MTTTQTQAPDQWYGAIAHTEFGSNDVAATKSFLADIFGMTFELAEGSPMEYHMAYTPGQPSCAVRPLMEQEPAPSQTPFVNVENIDKTIKTATANGANIVLPKTPIPKMGWMAWMTIPGGLTIAAWQADENAG